MCSTSYGQNIKDKDFYDCLKIATNLEKRLSDCEILLAIRAKRIDVMKNQNILSKKLQADLKKQLRKSKKIGLITKIGLPIAFVLGFLLAK